jgi:hypothetical protein
VAIIKPYSNAQLIWRSLVPSGTSAILCIISGILTVFIGLLRADSEQASSITSIHISGSTRMPIVSSLDRMLSHGSWTDIGFIVLWILFLLLAFGAIEFLFGSYASIRSRTEKDLTAGAGVRPNVSEWQWFFNRAVWRMMVGLIAIIVAVLLVQLAHWVSTLEGMTVTELSYFTQNTVRLGIAALSWALIYHAVVVFLRFYMFRTRVFGGRDLY